MKRANCDVFISYRRQGGSELAQLVYKDMKARGYRVFMDVRELPSGHFDDELRRQVGGAQDFVLLLTPGSLDRCIQSGEDWVRQEIALALKLKLNIAPLMARGFQFPDSEKLPAELRDLPRHNAKEYSHDDSDGALARLRGMLTSKPSWLRASRTRLTAVGLVAAAVLAALGIWFGFGGLNKQTKAVLQDTAEIKLQTGAIQQDTDQIKQDTGNLRKDTVEVRRRTEAIHKDAVEIKQDTSALRKDTAEVRRGTEAIHKDAGEIKQGIQGVNDTLTQVSSAIEDLAQQNGPIKDPKTKDDFFSNICYYSLSDDYDKALSSYQKYFELETNDFYDDRLGFWMFLERCLRDNDKVSEIFSEVMKKHDSQGTQLVLLAKDRRSESASKLRTWVRENSDYLPGYLALFDKLPRKMIVDLAELAELQVEYQKRGGFDAIRKYLHNPDNGLLSTMAKRFGEAKPRNLSGAVQVEYSSEPYIHLLAIGINDDVLPRQITLKFPGDGPSVTVPLGEENPVGIDEPYVLFELKSGRPGRIRFEPRAENDRRMYKHCGALYGLASGRCMVTVGFVDATGRSFTFPQPINLGVASFSLKVVPPDPMPVGPRLGPVLQITHISFLNSCEIATAQEGPFVKVPQHWSVPAIRQIELNQIPGLVIQHGDHHVWVRGTTDGGLAINPEQLTFRIPKNLPGLREMQSRSPESKPITVPLERIPGSAQFLAFSPNGKLIALVDGTPKVRLWNVAAKQIESTLTQEAGVTISAFSSDGAQLATAFGESQDNVRLQQQEILIRIWDLKQGKIRQELSGPSEPTFALAFTPDGKTLVSTHRDVSRKATVRLWKLVQGTPDGELQEHSCQEIHSLAISPNGKYLVVGGDRGQRGQVNLWDLGRRQMIRTFSGEEDGIDALAFSPNNEQLLIGSAGALNSTRLWDIQTGENLAARISLRGRCHHVAFASSGRPLLIDVVDYEATVWDVAAGKPILSLRDNDFIRAIAFAPNGKLLATGGTTIKLWKLAE
ncbi:MAG: TIR domain-containing protein [Planctomycetota bacterium]